MILSIIIAAIQELLCLMLLYFSKMEKPPVTAEEYDALYFGIALFTLLLSVPMIMWNVMSFKGGSKVRSIIGFCFAALTFAISFSMLLAHYIQTLHGVPFF